MLWGLRHWPAGVRRWVLLRVWVLVLWLLGHWVSILRRRLPHLHQHEQRWIGSAELSELRGARSLSPARLQVLSWEHIRVHRTRITKM